MDANAALLTFLHLLVFAYWLGGDIGAFVSSFVVTDTKRAASERFAAARILNDVDMAPRTALVLTAPSGVSLAAASGWLDATPWIQGALWAAAFAWLALIWRLHLSHASSGRALRRLDLVLRCAALAALLFVAIAFAGPLFIRIKLGLLAAAIGLGLLIRALLAPMGPGLAALARNETSPATDKPLADALGRARLGVIAIWIVLASAAFIGVAKPQ